MYNSNWGILIGVSLFISEATKYLPPLISVTRGVTATAASMVSDTELEPAAAPQVSCDWWRAVT